MNAIITLTTDFGLTDAYVAALKGVILEIALNGGSARDFLRAAVGNEVKIRLGKK
ncbi:MAG: SAM-dependent chlorinase/fluorinase [Dehalococcoidales bacterium]